MVTATESRLAGLKQRIDSREAQIGIVGMGYVGLPLALLFSGERFRVTGFDIEPGKVETLNSGGSYIVRILPSEIHEAQKAGFRATADYSEIARMDAVIICVPTPLNEHHEPDLSYVTGTVESIAPWLHEGQLVVLESTTYPGTTEEVVVPLLEAGNPSGLKASRTLDQPGVHVAFSPEREDPSNPDSQLGLIPKVVGGLTPACLQSAMELYGRAIKTMVPVASCRVAEAAKLLENIFRGVNIALINELKVVYQAMGIDIWEVIEAAKTKPFGFMPFYPGPGLGGHCIPIDPFYLTWKAREFSQHTRFIELAGEINTAMPQYVIDRVVEALNARRKAMNGSRVLLLGLAYKPDVDDERESPSYVLLNLLQERRAEVAYYDPHVPVIRPTREHSHWTGLRSIGWDRQAIESFDAVIIATHHRGVNYQELADWNSCIVDTRNVMAAFETKPGQVWKA